MPPDRPNVWSVLAFRVHAAYIYRLQVHAAAAAVVA